MKDNHTTEEIIKRFNKFSPSIAANLVSSFFTENLTQISKKHKIPINKISELENKLFFSFTGDQSQNDILHFLTQVACLDDDEASSVFKEIQSKFLSFLDKPPKSIPQNSQTEQNDLYLERIE